MTEPRLPLVTERDGLSPLGAEVWDAIAASRGGVRGPFSVLLNSPGAAGPIASVGAYLRYHTSLEPRLREFAILVTAATLECRFEFSQHRPIAIAAGVPLDVADALASGAENIVLPRELGLIATLARDLLIKHRTDDATFRGVREILGTLGATDLVATIGYYALLACVLNAVDDARG